MKKALQSLKLFQDLVKIQMSICTMAMHPALKFAYMAMMEIQLAQTKS